VKIAVAAIAGVLFGAGLLLSGMARSANVLGFLDVGGDWNPALAFVMVGAIGVHAICYRVILRRLRPIHDTRFHVPADRAIDARLLGGAAIFGVGWGISGFCPGPALISAAGGVTSALVFVGAMLLGSFLSRSPDR
jgi:uncharacterized membrane protein YedE/YeeE